MTRVLGKLMDCLVLWDTRLHAYHDPDRPLGRVLMKVSGIEHLKKVITKRLIPKIHEMEMIVGRRYGTTFHYHKNLFIRIMCHGLYSVPSAHNQPLSNYVADTCTYAHVGANASGPPTSSGLPVDHWYLPNRWNSSIPATPPSYYRRPPGTPPGVTRLQAYRNHPFPIPNPNFKSYGGGGLEFCMEGIHLDTVQELAPLKPYVAAIDLLGCGAAAFTPGCAGQNGDGPALCKQIAITTGSYVRAADVEQGYRGGYLQYLEFQQWKGTVSTYDPHGHMVHQVEGSKADFYSPYARYPHPVQYPNRNFFIPAD